MAKYFLTNKAVEDLSQIWEYTYELWSERQADRYYALLTGCFQEICNNPAFGKTYAEMDSALLGLRIGKHIVFYRLTKSGDTEIVRILHQRMDLKSKMGE